MLQSPGIMFKLGASGTLMVEGAGVQSKSSHDSMRIPGLLRLVRQLLALVLKQNLEGTYQS